VRPSAAWTVALLAAASLAGPAAAQASVRNDLLKVGKARALTRDLDLVVGPGEGVTLPDGAVLSARLTGSPTAALMLGWASGTRRLGAGSVVVRAGEATRVRLALTAQARRALRRARALVGDLELVLSAEGAQRETVRRRVTVYPSAPPRCFGAASRDPLRRCVNPELRRVVLPTPQDALLAPNAPCTPLESRLPYVCAFGRTADPDRPAIALVGDSHASHWRAAVEVIADRKGWRGFSIARSGCPLSATVNVALTAGQQRACRRWNQATTDWLRAHPDIRTVFVSQNAGAQFASAPAEGYAEAWRRLPSSVERLVVIRDVPHNGVGTSDCVERVLRRGGRTAGACAVGRARALRPDPAVAAASAFGSGRVRVVDLTRYFCSTALCFPVVGGALVHKDYDHITDLFAVTLGPYLQRHVERVLR
jgi:hypothetical protein